MKELIALLFFIALLLLGLSLRRRKAPVDLLERLQLQEDMPLVKAAQATKKGPIGKLAQRFYSGQSRFVNQRLLLKQADVPMTYEEVVLFKLLFMSALGLLSYVFTRDVIILAFVVIGIWIVPNIVLKMRRKSNIAQFDEQLNDAIVIMSNALKAGYSFLQALAVAAEESADPLGKTFKLLLKELSLGMGMEDALANLVKRMPSEDLMLMVNAILIQKDVGGNLSEILENISETIRERQKIKNEVKTLTAQGKLSGGIVMALPILLGAAIYLFNKPYMMLLFTTALGRLMVGMALVSQFLGWLMIRKIISIDL